jgi:hypothetical protein
MNTLRARARFSLPEGDRTPTIMQRMYRQANEDTPQEVKIDNWLKLLAWMFGKWGPPVVVPIVFAAICSLFTWSVYRDNVAMTKAAVESVAIQAKANSEIAVAINHQADAINRLADEVKDAHLRAVGSH